MAQVACARCGASAEGLARAPLPGPAGEQVLAGTCAECWQIWLGEQVKLINENKLSPANPEHFNSLLQQMREFLRLSNEGQA